MSLKSSKKIETNLYELELKVEKEMWEDAIEKAFQKTRKQINVPGFRKGKAPRGMIEKIYGKDVFYNDAFEVVYPEVIEAGVKEAELELVDSPYDIDFKDIGDDGVVFTIKATVKPDVEIKNYKGLKVEKCSSEVTEDDVNAQLDQMRERSARLVEVDRKAKKGDLATIDFEGFVGDEAFDGGKAEEYELELGSGSFIPGFEDQIIGHKAGEEFDIQVKFPEEYNAENLAGKDATFKIKLHAVKEKELPELDDEFAKDVSEFDTLDELKEDTKKNLAEQKAEHAEQDVEQGVLTQLADLVEGEIPECMFEHAIDDAVNEFGYQIQQSGMDLDMYLSYTGMTAETVREQFKPRAITQVKCKLALDKIASLEKIEVSDEDVDARYKEMADQYGVEEKIVRNAFPKEEVVKDMRGQKALDLVKAAAKVTEKKAEAKKTAEKKPAAKKSTAKKTSSEKEPAKKTTAKTTAAKKPAAKTSAAKKADSEGAEKKPAAKKPAAKKTTKKTEE